MIREYDGAVEDFDESMTRVYNSEAERIEAERKLQEFLASNAGKPAGYFKLPAFLQGKQSAQLKWRLQDLGTRKEKTRDKSV